MRHTLAAMFFVFMCLLGSLGCDIDEALGPAIHAAPRAVVCGVGTTPSAAPCGH